MRKFLNTLFVLSEDSYLSLDGETVLVLSGEQKRGQFPLHTLEGKSGTDGKMRARRD